MSSALLSGWLVAFVAASTPGPQALTFDEAIELSIAHPDQVGRTRALETRRTLDEDISRIAYDPQFMVMPGYRSNPADSKGMEVQLILSQSWSLEGLGSRRKEAAGHERAQLSAGLRAAALERRLEVARCWIELWVHEADERRVAEARALVQDLVDKLTRAEAAGAVLRTDLVEAQAFLAQMHAQAVDAEGERVHAGFELAEALGLPSTSALRTEGAPPQPRLPEPSTWPKWIERAVALPAVEQARLTGLAARAQAAEAKASGGWSLQTQASVQRESPASYISWLGVGVQLPIFNGGRRARAQAEAAAAQAETQQASRAAEAARTVAMALHEVEHGQERVQVMTEELLPALDALVELRTAAFAAGEETALELLRAKQRQVATARQQAFAQGDLKWAEVRAWLLLAALQGAEAVAGGDGR